MERRGFLKSILAAMSAPVFIKSDVGILMPASSGYLVPNMRLHFITGGVKSLLPGDTLNVTTTLAEGTSILTSFAAVSSGTCDGCRVFLDSVGPKVSPIGDVQFVENYQNIHNWQNYHKTVERHLSNA